jgi:segregation and condensation protein B
VSGDNEEQPEGEKPPEGEQQPELSGDTETMAAVDPTAFDENEPTSAQRGRPEGVLPGDLPEGFDLDGSSSANLESIVESLLFAADKPLAIKQIADLLGEGDAEKVKAAVDAVTAHYGERGVQLQAVAGGYQFRTHPRNAMWVQKLLAQKPVRLSRAQLETLAIVSYRQPITRPEIDEIRGVDTGGSLKTLMDRSLIRILGKKEEPGRPLLYGTTKEFLGFFNLSDLKDLPTLREFHELSDEHQAQVEALESQAPEGSIETVEEAASRPLERVELKVPEDDGKELEEIDRLIQSAGRDTTEMPAVKPDEPASE